MRTQKKESHGLGQDYLQICWVLSSSESSLIHTVSIRFLPSGSSESLLCTSPTSHIAGHMAGRIAAHAQFAVAWHDSLNQAVLHGRKHNAEMGSLLGVLLPFPAFRCTFTLFSKMGRFYSPREKSSRIQDPIGKKSQK